jgi:4-alpha-glucanotransferase
MTSASSLQQLADVVGIVSEYHDIWGNPHSTSDATRRGLLQAMGIACASEAEIEASLQHWQMRHWQQRLAPVQVAPVAQPIKVRLHLPQSESATRLTWTLKLENGEQLSAEFQPDQLRHLDATDISGTTWHALELELPAHQHQRLSPAKCRWR